MAAVRRFTVSERRSMGVCMVGLPVAEVQAGGLCAVLITQRPPTATPAYVQLHAPQTSCQPKTGSRDDHQAGCTAVSQRGDGAHCFAWRPSSEIRFEWGGGIKPQVASTTSLDAGLATNRRHRRSGKGRERSFNQACQFVRMRAMNPIERSVAIGSASRF